MCHAPLLSLHCQPAYPALHPFPTRRSSDLSPARGRRGSRRDRVPSPPERSEEDPLQACELLRRGAEGPWRRSSHACKDRKSTRLNSSHRCISYAVFCLKKKIVWIVTD